MCWPTTGGAEKVLHFGSKVTSAVEIRISFAEQGWINTRLRFSPQPGMNLSQPPSLPITGTNRITYVLMLSLFRPQGRTAAISVPDFTQIEEYIRGRLGSWRLYHLHDTSNGPTHQEDGGCEWQSLFASWRLQSGCLSMTISCEIQFREALK